MNIFSITAIMLILLHAAGINAQTAPIVLWPAGAPLAAGKMPEDAPAITPFFPAKSKANGSAILILPGGGYGHLSDVKEGSAVAQYFNNFGVTAFVLKYRLGPRYREPVPLLDAARAVRLVRARFREWNLDPARIGVLGFSAGGHLASTLGTHFDAGDANSSDPVERMSSRPDAMMLIYPVISMGEFTHAGSRKNLLGENPAGESIKKYSNELQVTGETPPAFLVHTMADPGVPVENSLLFAAALRRAKVPFEIHIYEQGPHGFGLAPNDPVLSTWAERCVDWLRVRNFIPKTVD